MTDATFRFSVCWAGSNKIIASRLLLKPEYPLWLNSSRLQEQVGALVNIDPKYIKILLGSPAGPQLTPVIFTVALVGKYTMTEEFPPHSAMVAAWSSLKADQVVNVFVTQHSTVTLAIDKIARAANFGSNQYAYNELPFAMQRNPAVALAALDLRKGLNVRLPKELKINKQFALAAMGRTCAEDDWFLIYFSGTLRDNEEVVLKAVERSNYKAMWYASSRLRECKKFVLQALLVDGLCIYFAAPKLWEDKDVALAAVRQNAAVFEHLCDRLKADTDIQKACKTAQFEINHV